MQDRYREAIAVFERVLPRLGGRYLLGTLLALAYVAIGDEQNARRLLTSIGRSEADIPKHLEDVREQARRRVRR